MEINYMEKLVLYAQVQYKSHIQTDNNASINPYS